MTTTTIRNGIDVDQLLATIGAIEDDGALGAFTFRASSSWKDGTHNPPCPPTRSASFKRSSTDSRTREFAWPRT
ncbi:hypothetical protein [Glycomyces sp. YM15]|uniref:hypothetical protein n=1 Tax=Glycomyces sp. YM15 TaxID=2800446 RepID=UPI0019626B15|nr:hypothetical protein [Glycomyces sp. YM15]